MTKTEILWAAQALKYAKRYDDCEPDVGMGLSDETLLDQITPSGILLTENDIESIMFHVNN